MMIDGGMPNLLVSELTILHNARGARKGDRNNTRGAETCAAQKQHDDKASNPPVQVELISFQSGRLIICSPNYRTFGYFWSELL
jgi:hypothetical protein